MRKYLICFLISIIIFNSCGEKRHNINTDNVKIKIIRFDQDLFNMNIDSLEKDFVFLSENYGNFLDLYFKGVIQIGDIDSEMFFENLKFFLTDYSIFKAYSESQKEFNDISRIEREFSDAFSNYISNFPDKKVPSVYTIITGFNQSIIIDECILAIGIEKYLGRNCSLYDRLMIPNYLRLNMHKEMIVSDGIKAWGLTEFIYNDSIDNLINNMIYHGKIHYFQHILLPDLPDSIIFGFTGKQVEWCIANEKRMWKYLVENKLLFDNNPLTIRKFTEPSPFTKSFSSNSPGRAVNWLGYKIVEKYMQKNLKVNLNELMDNDNYREILQKARYR